MIKQNHSTNDTLRQRGMSHFCGSRAALWTVLVTISLLFGLYSYFTPEAFDDFLFKGIYIEYNEGETNFSFSALIDYASEIRQNDNGRLSNILCAPAMLFLPHWLFAVISGIGFAMIYLLMAEIARISTRRRAASILAVCAFSLVLLPFRNSIIVCDYLLNYLYPSLAILFLIYLLKDIESRKTGWLFITCTSLVAIIAGWFHEGFSAPVCMGFGVFALYKRFRLPLRWWIPVILFVLATIWTVTAPGTFARADRELGGHSLSEKLNICLTVLPAVMIMLVLWVVSFRIRRLKTAFSALFHRQETLVLFVASLVAAVMILSINSDARAGWPGELYAFTFILSLAPLLHISVSQKLTCGVSAVIYLLLCSFFINLIVCQRKFYKQSEEIIGLLEKSDNGTIFYDIIDPASTQMRLTTLFMTTRFLWVTSFHYRSLSGLYDVTDKSTKHEFAVVPSALSSFDLKKSRPIESDKSIWEYNDILVAKNIMDDQPRYAGERIFRFETADGRIFDSATCFVIRFTAPDGEKFDYIYPFIPVHGKIVKAELLD